MANVTSQSTGSPLTGLRMRYLMLLDLACMWLAIVLAFLVHRIRRGWLAFQRWRRRDTTAPA